MGSIMQRIPDTILFGQLTPWYHDCDPNCGMNQTLVALE